ncbi:MAG: DNA topoisomerase, partial [Quisquiliibacterium sp.]
AEYLVTTRITAAGNHHFKTEGRVLKEPGWLAVYGRAGESATDSSAGTGRGDTMLVPVKDGEQVVTERLEVVALATKPPARYSEATLLSAMEGAGKLIEDDELREAMAEKGLGTPATRAAIIEGLIAENYLIREGRELIPTTKAFQLLTLLRGLGVQELTMPELTGEWEYKLSEMERGKLGRKQFMKEIGEVTRRIVERAKNYQADTVPGDYVTLSTKCPKCGGTVQENYKRFACASCDFSITKTPGARQLEVAEAEQLLRDRTVGPLQGFRSRLGRPFAAILKLTPESKLEFDFGQSGDQSEAAEPVDFSGQQALGNCPKCARPVFEHGMFYVCEKSVGPDRSCDFRTGKIILQQEVSREQAAKLLDEGRSDLLTGFISSRTRRKFKAYLVRGADGNVGFEFQARPGSDTIKPAERGPRKAGASSGTVTTSEPGSAGGQNASKAAKAPATKKAGAAKTSSKKPRAKKSPAKKAAAKKTGSRLAGRASDPG